MTEDKFILMRNDAIENMIKEGMGKYVTKKEAIAETRNVFFSSRKMPSGEDIQTYAVQTWVTE